MDFHHRKLLILKPNEEKIDYDPCDDDKCLYVTIQFSTPPPPPPPLNHNTSSLLILMLCILGIGFVLVLYFSVVRYRSRNFTRTNTHPINSTRQDFIDENHGPIVDHPIWYIRTIGLQQSVIDSIAVFQFKKDDKLIEGSECSICLSEFEEDESLRLLPKCSHAFHIPCIDTWLRSHQNCPVCRAPIITIVNPTQDEENLEENLSEESVEMENHEEEGENQVQSIDPSEEEIDYENTRKKNVRVKSDLASYGVQFDEEMEKVRRSISLDMNITSMDKVLVEGEGSSSNKDEVELQKMKGNKNSSIYKLMKSSSLGRSLQKMPISMKRSFSSTTGKSSLSIHTSN